MAATLVAPASEIGKQVVDGIRKRLVAQVRVCRDVRES
jgi:hypothetical protein